MPGLNRYDKLFGGERGSAQRVLDGMKKTYGSADGRKVFDATILKRERRSKAARKGGRR